MVVGKVDFLQVLILGQAFQQRTIEVALQVVVANIQSSQEARVPNVIGELLDRFTSEWSLHQSEAPDEGVPGYAVDQVLQGSGRHLALYEFQSVELVRKRLMEKGLEMNRSFKAKLLVFQGKRLQLL